MAAPKTLALILAGGSGTRFWPASRPENPKQYLKLWGDESLIQKTVSRLNPVVGVNDIYICSTEDQQNLLRTQLPAISHLILEPEGRNTAACIALSTLRLLAEGHSPDTVVAVLPADHFISEEARFREQIARAAQVARETGGLVTLGIQPIFPHTGYGYIERGEPLPGTAGVHKVRQFKEKPDAATAAHYLEQRRFYWNSGMFIWTLSAIRQAFERYLPELWSALRGAGDGGPLKRIYGSLPSLPIDTGVLEKAENVYVLPSEMGWSDVGSWSAVYDLQTPDANGNIAHGAKAEFIESEQCFVFGRSQAEVALVGVEDLIVVVEGDRVLVCNRAQDQHVREAAKRFK